MVIERVEVIVTAMMEIFFRNDAFIAGPFFCSVYG
jgi:hypothetical protein